MLRLNPPLLGSVVIFVIIIIIVIVIVAAPVLLPALVILVFVGHSYQYCYRPSYKVLGSLCFWV